MKMNKHEIIRWHLEKYAENLCRPVTFTFYDKWLILIKFCKWIEKAKLCTPLSYMAMPSLTGLEEMIEIKTIVI